MRLIPVDPGNEAHLKALYDLLAERTPEQSISHKRMPTWEEHVAFVKEMAPRPLRLVDDPESFYAYRDWCIISDPEYVSQGRQKTADVGAIYLSCRNEIGVNVTAFFRRRGYAYEAVRILITKHGSRRYLWNVNPTNEASIALARKLGFGGPIQHTYSLEVL